MWATYQHDRIDPIRDSRVFTNYVPDQVKDIQKINNNEEYRRFLVQNTNELMRQNYENVASGNDTPYGHDQINNGPPVRFDMEQKRPYGYEDSHAKQMYLSRTQLDEKKRRLLKEEY